MRSEKSFFHKRQKLLGIAATAYLVLLLLSHWQLPSIHVWVIAVVFSIAMNFTYLTEAFSLGKYFKVEVLIASTLIGASVASIVLSPLLVIAAIFGHGFWDLKKHFGAGVPFFFWYTCSCFVVDTVYGSTLLIYWFSIN